MDKMEKKKEWQDIIKKSTFAKSIALLSIFLIFSVILEYLGFYSSIIKPGLGGPAQCIFPAGFTCVTYKLQALTGKLYLVVGQGIGHTIRVTGINCTQDTSADFATSGLIYYGAAANNVTIASGSKAVLSTPNDPTKTWLDISCTDSNGAALASQPIGAVYSGRIYVNYTEVETGIQRIAVGTFTVKYEA